MTGQITDLTFDNRDEFQRRPIAERIIKLLKSDLSVSPIVIDGSWGSGKTEFCHKLINLIEAQPSGEKPLRAVFVDAFKADHANDPLMTLMVAILSVLPEPERQPVKDKVMPILRFGIKTSGKAALSWLLKRDAADVLQDFEGDLKAAGDHIIDQAVESMIQEYEKASLNLKALQDGLTLIGENGPLVVFIDELDRCRPDFAVSMLEVIKHVFDINQAVKFALVTNVKQLEAAILHRYGAVDAEKYLGKFLGFRFSLPSLTNFSSYASKSHVSKSHFTNLVRKSAHLSQSILRESATEGLVNHYIANNHLSLRDVEKLIANFEIYQILADKALKQPFSYGYHMQIVLGICLFTFMPYLAQRILSNSFTADELVQGLGIDLNDINIKGRPNFVEIMFYLITIQARHPNEREGAALTEGEEAAVALFNQFYSRHHFPPDSHERTEVLMRTLRVMGLSEN